MSVCILISGHMRFYDFENVYKYIFKPLKEAGYNTYTFLSTWMFDELRIEGSLYKTDKELDAKIISNTLKSKGIDVINIYIEENSSFLKNYTIKVPTNVKTHVGTETTINASSMYYKLQQCFDMADSYFKKNNIIPDIVLRIRPDIIYHNEININDINYTKNLVNNNYLYMAEWHCKYEEVTLKIMDCMFFGNYSTMSKVCKLFNNINNYISDGIDVATAEGIMNECLRRNSISLLRTDIQYSIIRHDGFDRKTIDKTI